jgi:dolichol kinase
MDDGRALRRAILLRKLIHVGTAIVPVAGWLVSFQLALGLAGAMAGASLVLEAARRWWPWVNRLLWRRIPSVFRAGEQQNVLGSTWLAVGMLLTLLLFGRDVGGTAVLFLTWGDPAAELIGRRWGRPGQRKSVAGSLGCLGVCLLAAGVGIWLGLLNPVAAMAGAVAATLVERWSPPPDDNVWMPLLSGLVILLMQRLTG